MDGNRFFFGINGSDGEVRAAARIGGGQWPAVITAARDVLRRWSARTRQRRALALLDGRLLADIGVGPGEARREAGKPFWRR